MVAEDPSRRTLAGMSQDRSSPLTPSLLSMLERGQRRWTPASVRSISKSLGIAGASIQRAYIDGAIETSFPGLVSPQDAADLLDDLISGTGSALTASHLIEVVRWVTLRQDPLGRSSWESIVRKVVDRACDTKGHIAEACDMALPPLAAHAVAGEIFLEYSHQIASESGHPKAFVPIIALQDSRAVVDAPALLRELETPTNRWLIRENLNLAAAQLTNPLVISNSELPDRFGRAAYAWLVDSGSEHEVRRAAARVLRVLGLGSIGAVRRIHLADDVARISTGLMQTSAKEMVGLDALGAITSLGAAHNLDLDETDDLLLELLAASLYGASDHERRAATRWLYFSAYRPALANQASTKLASARVSDLDSGALRSWVRLLGKLGSSPNDASALLRIIQRPEMPLATLETALWALSDIAPIALPHLPAPDWFALLDSLPNRSRSTTERAVISTLGRSAQWATLESLSHLLPEPENERRWWLERRAGRRK